MSSSGDDDSHARTLVASPRAPSPASVDTTTAHRVVVVAGRYEVLALLGVGGMGAVYRARDLELDEPVALKMLRRELIAVPGALERFRQEVKLARKVTSPNVARTFDIGEHEGEKFLTMELVDGESLADEMQRVGPMPVGRVLAIAADVSSGLAAAHAASVVHRDLKPENVLIAKDGAIKITDFGIAKAQADVRVTNGVSGTPAYMAPEQVMADAKIDARADIYALGLMLYEMLTGEIPWKGDSSYAVASARLLSAAPDVRALRPDVPGALAALILRCMAKDRDERPSDASAVAATLARMTRTSDLPPSSVARPAAPFLARSAHAKTVAVLPLRNRGDASDDYLADGLTDDLIDNLSMASGLRVRARGAVMCFKGEERDPRELGRELGVHVFVAGAVERVGALVRLSVRLVSVEDSFQLWAKRFERPAADLFAVGEEVARAIAGALHVATAAKPEMTRDPAVVDLYLRARHAYYILTPTSSERAVALFEEALVLAPDDPTILAGAAMAHLAYISMHAVMGEGFDKATTIAERAVAIAPELADGHVALANLRLYDGRELEAVHEARLAIAAAPSNPEAHRILGRFFSESGRPIEAIAHLEVAQSLDPRLDSAIAEHARVHALCGEWDLAEARLARIEIDVADAPFIYWANLMRFLMWERNPSRTARVIAAARAATGRKPNIESTAALLEGHDANGHEADLDRWLALSNTKRRRAFFHQLKAEIAGFKAQAEPCISAIAASDELGLTDLGWLDACPLLDFVRADPRFAEARSHIAGRADAILAALAAPRAS